MSQVEGIPHEHPLAMSKLMVELPLLEKVMITQIQDLTLNHLITLKKL